MRPQIRNAVLSLITSFLVFVGAFQFEGVREVQYENYDYFLWGALSLALIIVRDTLEPGYYKAADRIGLHGRLITLVGLMVIANVATGLYGVQLENEIPERFRDFEEGAHQAVFLFGLSAALLFAKEVALESTASDQGSSRGCTGCFGHMLLLAFVAGMLGDLSRAALHYPASILNDGIAFVASLSFVMVIREGLRLRREAGENR